MKSCFLQMVAVMAVAAAGVQAVPAADQGDRGHTVMELRQYKINKGQRDAFIPFFEREFIDTQEAVGMRLIGQFRERDDPTRFVWLRAFTDMTARGAQLPAFYFGPVWKAHREEANAMLDDNDDVLMLRPVSPADDFAAPKNRRAAIGAAAPPKGIIVANILYLWKDPNTGFADFFDAKMKPALERAGLPVLGAFVPETEPNNFPRLPVRQGEKLLVWFTQAPDQTAYDRSWKDLVGSPAWRDQISPVLTDAQERAPQVLHLDPTPRSALR